MFEWVICFFYNEMNLLAVVEKVSDEAALFSLYHVFKNSTISEDLLQMTKCHTRVSAP